VLWFVAEKDFLGAVKEVWIFFLASLRKVAIYMKIVTTAFAHRFNEPSICFLPRFFIFLTLSFEFLKLKILLKLLPYFSFVLAQIMFV